MNRPVYLLVLFFIFCLPKPAHALLPPDLIFSIGASVVQFFSIAAIVVGGLFSSIVFVARRWFVISTNKIWLTISIIFGIVAVSILIAYTVDLKKQEVGYEQEIKVLKLSNLNLEQKLGNSVPYIDYQTLQSLIEGDNPFMMPDIFPSTTSVSGYEKTFLSDTITLYEDGVDSPFTLEIDFNRIESKEGVFSHYTFINGYTGDTNFTYYDVTYSTTTGLLPNSYVKNIEKISSSDISPRDKYKGTVLLDGEPLTFFITGLEGDFITRHTPEYTRFQSVGTAEVAYRGRTFTAQALVENSHSYDASKYIFFPGHDMVDATTHQFILWDEDNNFYMIDNSDVRSIIAEYPSHTWLLYKNSDSLVNKKSFQSVILPKKNEGGMAGWHVTAREFSNASIDLLPLVLFKQEDGRMRVLVTGTVTDDQGSRSIGGVLHLIE